MDKEQKAIERIKMASEMSLQHYGRPLVCTYSGGKDSDVMLELFKRSVSYTHLDVYKRQEEQFRQEFYYVS